MVLKFPHKSLGLTAPAVMGILNVTPDSFFDGGKYDSEEKIIDQVEKMLREGASIIDVGACSTRPGAKELAVEEELKRLLPVLSLIRKKFPQAVISVDTYRAEVAKGSIKCGADMINDVSGGTLDAKMFDAIAEAGVPYVLMHMRGKPETMSRYTDYDDVVSAVMNYFVERIQLARRSGIGQLILDPGFGFAKTTEQNYELLSALPLMKELGCPILTGVSQKSMINKIIGSSSSEALNGTTVMNTIALMHGADILRVHDVKEAVEAVKIISFATGNKLTV